MLCPPQLTLSYVRQLSYHHLWMFVTSMFTGGLTLYQFVAVSKDSSARTPFGNLARQAGLQQLGQHRPWRSWIMLWSWEYDENIHGKHHGIFLSLSPFILNTTQKPKTMVDMEYLPTFTQKLTQMIPYVGKYTIHGAYGIVYFYNQLMAIYGHSIVFIILWCIVYLWVAMVCIIWYAHVPDTPAKMESWTNKIRKLYKMIKKTPDNSMITSKNCFYMRQNMASPAFFSRWSLFRSGKI